jgi:Holliday junction resolvasome RuvABC endonuclease subunit
MKDLPLTHPERDDPVPLRILAVDPGARYMGVAVLVGDELVRADVENIRATGMSATDVGANVQAVLRRWIRLYQPHALVVELPEFAQSKASRQLRRLVRTIAATGRKAGIEVQTYAPSKVRRQMCPEGRPTRLAVARAVAEHFPDLARYYRAEAAKSWWEKPYWLTMFDAVALGLVCHQDHARRRKRDIAA